jgi:endonuclease/exonuclease/phosphatase (EEP) superfamily protein YafD
VEATLAAFRALARAATGVLAVIALIHLSGVTSWPLELLHHFLVVYALVAAVLTIAAICFRVVRLAALTAVLALFFAGAYARSVDPFGGAEAPGKSITLITNNVYCRNWDAGGLRDWLATRPADIVALQEVPPHVERTLAPLAARGVYPYSARIPAAPGLSRGRLSGCEGILLLSTVPIASATIYQPNQQAWPALIGRLEVPDVGDVWIVAVHATDPIRAKGLALRDEFLASLAPTIASLSGPVIVAGDFNATPFTPVFRQFLAEARITPPGRFPGSYSANLGAFGLPIDHIMVRDAHLPAVRALRPTGSDHRPLLARIVLPTDPLASPGSVDSARSSK